MRSLTPGSARAILRTRSYERTAPDCPARLDGATDLASAEHPQHVTQSGSSGATRDREWSLSARSGGGAYRRVCRTPRRARNHRRLRSLGVRDLLDCVCVGAVSLHARCQRSVVRSNEQRVVVDPLPCAGVGDALEHRGRTRLDLLPRRPRPSPYATRAPLGRHCHAADPGNCLGERPRRTVGASDQEGVADHVIARAEGT